MKDHWIDPQDGKSYDDQYAPIWPWRVAIWNDFKARMDWCVQPYAKANHHPERDESIFWTTCQIREFSFGTIVLVAVTFVMAAIFA